MALVKEYMDGNCKIHIYDDYCIKDKVEIQKILDRISLMYSKYFSEHPERYEGMIPIQKKIKCDIL